jgi:hypothetical protein
MATKKCENCDAEIGESEKDCPKCGVNFEDLDNAVSGYESARTISEKRLKAKNPNCDKCGKPKHEGDCEKAPKTTKKKGGLFSNLGAALKKKGA